MFKKMFLSAAVIAAASLGSLAPVAATAQQYTIVRVAPPQPVQEAVPAPRRGFVWVPGYYDYRNNQYVRVSGHWERARPGHEWRETRWVERDGEWRRVGGEWQRRGPRGDRDRDGIANRYDRDKDGDGIANRYDDRPNRPDRHARSERRFGPNGDLDRDGIRNRDDRDRDGDGVRNRRDRFPNDRDRS